MLIPDAEANSQPGSVTRFLRRMKWMFDPDDQVPVERNMASLPIEPRP